MDKVNQGATVTSGKLSDILEKATTESAFAWQHASNKRNLCLNILGISERFEHTNVWIDALESRYLKLIQLNESQNKEKAPRKSGAIPLWTEDSESLKDRRLLGCGLEHCVFCGEKTSTWHENTNNPICLKCAKIYKVEDIPEDFGQKIRQQKRSKTFDRGDSVRAN